MTGVATPTMDRSPSRTVNFGKKWWLAMLAMLAPLPLPFNEILGWPLLVVFWLAVVAFLRELEQGRVAWLPNWAMNLLGLAYLPVFYIDLAVFFDGRLLPPLVHLALFVLAVKLFALKSDRDHWHAMLAIFFLFLASMGTSVHPSIVVYLLLFLVGAMLVLARFAGGHVQSQFGNQNAAPVRSRAFLSLGVPFTLLVAIPLFAILPRFDNPYLFANRSAGGGQNRMTGFTERMSLDGIGRTRLSREVVMRLRYDEGVRPNADRLRLKGAAYEYFRDNSWRRGQLRSFPIARSGADTYRIGRDEPLGWAEVWMQPHGGRNLVAPLETVAIEIEGTGLQVDQAGVISLYGPARSTLYYKVGVSDEPISEFRRPPGRDDEAPTFLDLAGVTPRIEELAERVLGVGSTAAQIARLEQHLTEDYEYTLDLMGRSGEGLIDKFLFEDRRGHCEYFATAMVLMLRSQEIPARVVTGFYGAEYSRRQDYYIVRQSSAHAWVEAYVEGAGWVTFDPTPPAGRPESTSSWQAELAQAWDAFIFRWDRYVLTYGVYDQLRAFQSIAGLWRDFWKQDETPQAERVESSPTEENTDGPSFEISTEFGLIFVLLALIGGAIVWWRRPRFSPGLAYTRLRQKLPNVDRVRLETLPPLEVRERFEKAYPDAAEPAAQVFDLYVETSFGGRTLEKGEADELRESHREALRRVRASRYRRSA